VVNRDNYLLVRSFLQYLREVTQLSADSVERYRFYLRHLLLWADETPLSEAHSLRPTLPDYLSALCASTTGRAPRAAETQSKIIYNTKRLFTWAKLDQPRDFRNVPTAWIDALRPSRGTAGHDGEHVFVTLDEVRWLIAVPNPQNDLALGRDQAAAALLFLSGMRAGALGSLPIAALDLSARTVKQWPSLGVRTKNRKAATTYLLEIPDLIEVVQRWDDFIRAQLPPEAMWYTPVIVHLDGKTLSSDPAGLNRTVAVGKRMRRLFAAAGLPARSTHKFRHGHAVWALQHAQTMADYKAISMNLMHDDVRVTDGIYAPLLRSEVRERVSRLAEQSSPGAVSDEKLVEYLRQISKGQVSQALHILADQLAM
jgi:integrase